ncbi:hypothetical protein CR513_33090, partial [Mucuna pruriens]
MTLEISHNYMFYSFIREIWENLIETYSMKKDSNACYDIERLKMYKVDSIAYIGFVERRRIFKFLHGLNSEYDPIRVQILGKEKLSSLSKVFFIMWSEEAQ